MTMSTSSSIASEAKGSRAGAVVVDPAIAAVIQNAGAPVGVPKPVELPDMPGTSGFASSVVNIVNLLRHGVGYSSSRRDLYGDIYKVAFRGGKPIVLVWDADEIHKIQRNEGQVWSTAMGWDQVMFRDLDQRKGNIGVLLSLDFDEHRAARKLVQPAFTSKAIQGYLAIAEPHFERAQDEWLARGYVDFKAEIRTLLGRVAGEIFTGIEDPAVIAKVDRALFDFWSGIMAASRNPWLSPTFRRSRRGFQTLRDMCLALVPARRKAGGRDLFSQMCQVTDTEGLDDEALVRVFLTIMFGAFDTTSCGMASMAYLLAKHPEWQARVRAEACAAPRVLDLAATKELKELEWVWKETLRLMPVSSFLPRRALRAVRVGPYDLPAGAMVGAMIGGMGRHPKWWKDRLVFDPERFSPERAEDKQHPAIYGPFGAGPHACVGMQLATIEMKLFWHRLLRSCRFELAPDYEARHTNTPLGCVSGNVRLRLERLRD
jgi:cytochrome P450